MAEVVLELTAQLVLVLGAGPAGRRESTADLFRVERCFAVTSRGSLREEARLEEEDWCRRAG